MLVMSSLKSLTRLLSTSVGATASLLPLVPILRSFCHLDFVTPYHAIPPIFILKYHRTTFPFCSLFAIGPLSVV